MYITGEFYKNDWTKFEQRDDYSYNPADSYSDWKRMTAYIRTNWYGELSPIDKKNCHLENILQNIFNKVIFRCSIVL